MTAFFPNCLNPRLRWLLRIFFQCGSFALALFFTSAFASAADSSDHKFTDQQGRTLTAQIVRVAAPDVYLQSDNGQPYPVKISVLSAKDQAYVQQWGTAHQKAAETFAISAVRNSVDSPDGSIPQQGFEVTLKNSSSKDLVNLRVDYVVLRQPTPTTLAPLPRISGTTKVVSIPKNKENIFQSDRIQSKGSHVAIWVRVYDSRGNLLQEWSSAPDITKDEQWDDNSNDDNGADHGSHGPTHSLVSGETRATGEAADHAAASHGLGH